MLIQWAVAAILGMTIVPPLIIAMTSNWVSFTVWLAICLGALGWLSYWLVEPLGYKVQDDGSFGEAIGHLIISWAAIFLMIAWGALLLAAGSQAYRLARKRKRTKSE